MWEQVKEWKNKRNQRVSGIDIFINSVWKCGRT